jgi:rhomboid family GlyGly-CTERM serine protease
MERFDLSHLRSLHPVLWLWLAISFVAILGYWLPDYWVDWLVYQHYLIRQFQWWRLITAHFLHTNAMHLLLNLAALWLLYGLHHRFYQVKQQLVLWFCCSLGVSLGLYVFQPSLIQYVGLSGILHGIFIWGALHDIRVNDKTGYLLLFGVLAKLAHEQFFGASESVSELIQASVAINAHLFGALTGIIFYVSSRFLHPSNQPLNHKMKR